MAWGSLNTLGSNTNKVAGTTVVITTSATAEAGHVIVVAISMDNIQTADTEDGTDIVSVEDSAGNTYTRAKTMTRVGAAGDSITGGVYFSNVATELASGGTITVNHGSVTARAASAWEFSIGAGNVVTVEGTAVLSGNVADPPAITISGLTSGEYLWFHAFAHEGHVTGTYTQDADYSNITTAGTGGGSAVSNATIRGGFRVFSGTTDTVDVTYDTARDHVQVYVAFKEAAGGTSVALTGVEGTSGLGSLEVAVAKALTGVSATGSVGSLTLSQALGGVEATGAIGTLAPQASVALSGEAATGEVGTMNPGASVAISGISATGAVGTLVPSSGVTVALAGVVGTAAAGLLDVQASHALTGVAATGAVGTLSPSSGTFIPLTGVAATGAVGTIDVSATLDLTGVEATSAVGSLEPSMALALTGLSATGAVGTMVPSSGVQIALSGVSADALVGTLAPVMAVVMTGVSATGNVGTLSPVGGAVVDLTGVSATGSVGTLVPSFVGPKPVVRVVHVAADHVVRRVESVKGL